MSIRRLALFATPFALLVIVLGAFVRLSDAGLGCPDWPGCYGQLDVPQDAEELARANAAFPDRPVDVAKAWIEMIHRYAAATLGLLILAIGALACGASLAACLLPPLRWSRLFCFRACWACGPLPGSSSQWS